MSDICVKYVFKTKYVMLVLYLLCLVTALDNLGEPNDVGLAVMQLKALEHLKSLLVDVHSKIKNSRNVLQAIDLNKVFGASSKLPPETTMARPPVTNTQTRDTQVAIQFTSTAKIAQSVSKPSTLQTAASTSLDRITFGQTDAWDKGLKNHLRQEEVTGSGETTTFAPLELGDPHKNNASSPGDALFGDIKDEKTSTPDPTVKAFVEQAFVEKKGYLSYGLEKLCEAIMLKDVKYIARVFERAEYIVPELTGQNRLNWMGNPMLYVLNKVLMVCNEESPDAIKTYAQVLGYTMAHRRETLSEEVNYLIDFADSLVLIEEGNHIYSLINDFVLYPNSTRTAHAICIGIFEAFEMPFRKLGNTVDRAFLVKAGNEAIHSRYPDLPTDWLSPYRKSLSFRRHDRHFHRRKRKDPKHRLKYQRIRNISNNSRANNNNYLNHLFNLSRNRNPNDDKIAPKRSFYLEQAREEDKKEIKNVKEDTVKEDADKEAFIERRTATYAHVVSNEIMTRKLIENEFKNIKSTTKHNYNIVYETVTRKMFYDKDSTANKNRYIIRYNKNNKITNATDRSWKTIQIIKTTQYIAHKRITTDYKKTYRSPKNRFQLIKQQRQTNALKRFHTVHSRLIPADRRSDKLLNNYENRHENIAPDKSVNDDRKVTSNLNNIGYLQMAHQIKLIDQLIHYNNRLLNIDFKF